MVISGLWRKLLTVVQFDVMSGIEYAHAKHARNEEQKRNLV